MVLIDKQNNSQYIAAECRIEYGELLRKKGRLIKWQEYPSEVSRS